MSWGISSYGISSWGGADFVVINQFPPDDSVGAARLTTISFTLSSLGSDIDVSSINLTANGVDLIINGVFTSNATGSIDDTNLLSVNVIATVTHAFAPLTLVSIVVEALNDTGGSPVSGDSWNFTVDSTAYSFLTYIVNNFERILKVDTD